MDRDDDQELQAQIAEALRRSLEETNLEETNLAAALTNSLATRDEEIARDMQREDFKVYEQNLQNDCPPEDENDNDEWQVQSSSRRNVNRTNEQRSHSSYSPPRSQLPLSPAYLHSANAPSYRGSDPLGSHTTKPAPPARSWGYARRHQPQQRQAPTHHDFRNPPKWGESPPSPNRFAERARMPSSPPHSSHEMRPQSNNCSPAARGSNRSLSPRSPSRYPRPLHSPRGTPCSPEPSSLPTMQLGAPHVQQEQQATNASGHSPRSYASALSANIPGHNPPSPRRIAPHAPPPEAIPDVPIMIPEGEPTVVLDGQNIGREYGGSNSVFKSRGVQLALDHYARKGMSAVAVLPRNKVDQRPFLRNGMPNTLVADDPGLLLKLQDQRRVFFAPAGTHDDDMIIDYAMTKNAVIVSNDRYNRELERQVTAEDVRRVRSFLDSHLVPFTFHGDEFIPHPDPFQLGRNVHHSRVTGH